MRPACSHRTRAIARLCAKSHLASVLRAEGAEVEILKGAVETLKGVELILLETSIVHFNSGAMQHARRSVPSQRADTMPPRGRFGEAIAGRCHVQAHPPSALWYHTCMRLALTSWRELVPTATPCPRRWR